MVECVDFCRGHKNTAKTVGIANAVTELKFAKVADFPKEQQKQNNGKMTRNHIHNRRNLEDVT